MLTSVSSSWLHCTLYCNSGTAGGKDYKVDLEFLKPVNPEQSTWKVLPQSIQMHIIKADTEDEFWSRLPKDKSLEKNGISVDWNK
jgi:cytosolic prostaglandin-E synthase